ncbi:MAG: hypothetical protein LPK45_06160 [Bacteroidota bacterium]|nr:hypothetical protein [Bacteroidota bacterium]MDX5430653.1 hypothetical protein [Bacteroidota bacterium]MDX5469403.1 hypothetical protein [Bacteroidota bacterium]
MKDKNPLTQPKHLITRATKKLFNILKEEKKDIWLLYMYAVLSGIISLTLPLGVQAIITYLMGAYLSTSLVLLMVLVIVGTFFIGVLQLFQLSIVEVLQQRLFLRSSIEYAFRVPLLRINSTGKYLFNELANRFFDTVTLQKQVPKLLMDLSAALLQMLFGLILISFYHPFFAFFSLLVFLLLFLFFRISGPRGLESSLEESEEKYRIAFFLQGLGLDNFWSRAAAPFERGIRKVDWMVTSYLKARKRHFKVLRSQYQVLILFKTLIISILLIIGGNLVLDGQINLGQFIAAEIVIILIMGSVEKLLLSMEGIYDVLTAVEKVAKVPEQEIDSPEGFASTDEVSVLAIQGIKLKMGKSFEMPDLNLNLKKSVFFAGGHALERSVFKALVLGDLALESGSIRVDGLSLSEWNLVVWRQKVQTVRRVTQLSSISICDYLGIEDDSAKMKDALRYSDMLGLSKRLDEFGLTLRDPLYPLWVFNDEEILWQVGILRALISEAQLLIMDLYEWPDGLHRSVKMEELFTVSNKVFWVFDERLNPDKTWSTIQFASVLTEKGGNRA